MKRIFPRRRGKILRDAGGEVCAGYHIILVTTCLIILITTCLMSQVDPGEEAECEQLRAGRGAGAGCDQCPGQCSAEGVECHEVSCYWSTLQIQDSDWCLTFKSGCS